MKINLSTFFQSLGISCGNTSASNFYEFWYGITMNDNTITYNITEFMSYLGTNRYEFFKSLNSDYPEVIDEYTFYQNIDDPRIYDYYTFYTYAGEYLCASSPFPPTYTYESCLAPTPEEACDYPFSCSDFGYYWFVNQIPQVGDIMYYYNGTTYLPAIFTGEILYFGFHEISKIIELDGDTGIILSVSNCISPIPTPTPTPSPTPIEYPIGSGTTFSTAIPFPTSFNYSYTQAIYSPAIITGTTSPNKLFIGAQIKTLRYVIETPNPTGTTNIYIGTTTKTSFTSNTDWLPISAMTLVYSGNITSSGGRTNILNLIQPFTWNGDNIVIAVHKQGISVGDFKATNSVANSAIGYWSQTINPNPSSPPTALTRRPAIPNLIATL